MPEHEAGRTELIRKILLFTASFLAVLGLGWGLTVLFGYYWVIVDFAAAPEWTVVTAFISMPVTSAIFGFAVGDGSTIERGIKTVMVGVCFILLLQWPWSHPIILTTVCGLAAIALVALAGRILGIGAEPDWQNLGPVTNIQRQPGPPVPQIGKAEARRRDDEARRIKKEREQSEYEARKAGDEKPAED